ncbi:SGNH/GDSL hydrolase family protein [Novosphingobium sp. BL-8H]|uniref:SGNH/GDSL hydrolase family protein n=1 Tax=Novosphingobium sp. BL-8H TaxID=3127640 RepID=UPI003757D3CE
MQPSREGVLAAFTSLQFDVNAAVAGFKSYATVGLMNADTTQKIGTVGYVFANNGSASDAANGFYQWNGSAWVVAAWLASLITNAAGAVYEDKFGILSRLGPIYSYSAPYIDGTVLRWPAFYQRMANNTFAERAPADGQKWFEVGVPLGEEQGRFLVYYDATDNTLKTQTIYGSMTGLGSDTKPVLAHVGAGVLTSGIKPATIVSNDFDANSKGRPTVMGVDTTLVRTNTYSDLAGLGIFVGYASTDQFARVGGLFSSPEAQRVFTRVFVYDADGTPGTPIVPDFETFNAQYLVNRSQGLTSRGAILEKIYSTRLRSYLVDNRAATTDMAGIQAALNTGGRNVILAGLQIAASNDPNFVVPLINLAGSPKGDKFGSMYFPNEIAMFSDRKINLYPANFIDRRPMEADLVTLSRGTEGGALAPVAGHGQSIVAVDPSTIVDGETLTIAHHFNHPIPDQRQFKNVVARKVTPAQMAGKTFKVAFIGDSKVEFSQTADAVVAILAGYGATVQRVGTLGSGASVHEGRGGKTLAEYVGKDRTTLPPVATPADYINSSQRSFLNPFVVPGSGTGSYDGYIFDYAQYRTAYASITGGNADLAIVDLGSNDLVQWSNQDDFTAFVDEAMTRIITSIRGTGTKVLITPPAVAWDSYWYEVYTRMGYPLLRGLMRAVKRVNDPLNVRLSSAFTQMSPFAFGGYTASQVDADIDLSYGLITDRIHLFQEVRTQDAVAMAADIAAMMR